MYKIEKKKSVFPKYFASYSKPNDIEQRRIKKICTHEKVSMYRREKK